MLGVCRHQTTPSHSRMPRTNPSSNGQSEGLRRPRSWPRLCNPALAMRRLPVRRSAWPRLTLTITQSLSKRNKKSRNSHQRGQLLRRSTQSKPPQSIKSHLPCKSRTRCSKRPCRTRQSGLLYPLLSGPGECSRASPQIRHRQKAVRSSWAALSGAPAVRSRGTAHGTVKTASTGARVRSITFFSQWPSASPQVPRAARRERLTWDKSLRTSLRTRPMRMRRTVTRRHHLLEAMLRWRNNSGLAQGSPRRALSGYPPRARP